MGRRLELGANTYRVLVHPTSTERVLIGSGPAPIRAGEGLRAPVVMVVSPRPERAGQAEGGYNTILPRGRALQGVGLYSNAKTCL